ncbi:hypothetical protein AB0C34_06540 [Nocardia sp. NPDC049220]|uniref:hypothetical protein n=1 Tax=Nocardia sp. NPDC049220 TaxID=3155273 RepID=UPI00340C25A4
MLFSSPIALLASRRDWAVVTDATIRYRPDRIAGHRYRVTAKTPQPTDKPQSNSR